MPTKAYTPCPVCRAITDCEHRHNRSSTARGYGAQHRRLTADAIKSEPWCHSLDCPYPDAGTQANPLTGGHRYSLAELNGNQAEWDAQPRIPQCKRCNVGKRELA